MRRLLAGLVCVLAAGRLMAEPGDELAVRKLNADYLAAYVKSDAAAYRDLLAEDFRAVLSDGRVITRAEFLAQAAVPPFVSDFQVGEVVLQLHGDAGVVTGLATYRRPDGSAVRTRYLMVAARSEKRWRVVAAQFTRLAGE